MEENKDRKTADGMTPRESQNSARSAHESAAQKRAKQEAANAQRLADETLVFRREPVQKNTVNRTAANDLQHTAQIRGGAVIRPLKKTGNSQVNPSIAVQRSQQGTAAAQNQTVNRAPQVRPAMTGNLQKTPAAQQARSTTQTPAQRSQTPITPPKQPGTASQAPQVHPSARPTTANQPRNSVQSPSTRRRTENDDYEIDEASYTRTVRTQKPETAFADNATSAIMSLVKAVVYIIVIIAVSIGLSVLVINTANDIFKFVSEDRIVTVEIPEYATIEDVSDALYDAGAIKYKWAFNLWSGIKDSEAEFVPGVYEVSTTLNYDYLRSTFKKSTKRTEIRVTIIEGSTVDEIIDLFVEKGLGTRDAFVDVINNYDFDYRFLEGLTVSEDRIWRLEGYLFPDTYNFYLDTDPDTNASEITAIAKLLDNFNRKFADEYYDRCIDLGITVDEAVILASMIEKETRYADELGDVSSVFHNRLKYASSFPYLNSDATIMYAIAHDTGSRLDTMTGEDTAYDTPYNTYTRRGLPPGPIANPGLNALKYALYPNDTGYFYFVSDSVGRMLFAKTESEHLKNINTVRGN